jgi:RNA polymerase sigma-70 factor (ECF subfamily)
VTVVEAGDEQALQQLYAASYARLVGVVGAIGGDRSDAEEAVQEAFMRLMGHWPKVSTYDDPEAWVRRVALRLVSNRRRRALNGMRAALRHGPAPDVPAPTGHDVDLALSLRSRRGSGRSSCCAA